MWTYVIVTGVISTVAFTGLALWSWRVLRQART